MAHPLASLFDSRPDSAVAAGPKPPSPPGGHRAVDSGGGVGAAARGTADSLADSVVSTTVIPGITILAVQDPPGADGRPGAITFAPHLSFAARREIAGNLAWFDRVDAMRKVAPRTEGPV